MTASERILQLLDEKRMTQKEFAKLTGIPESTVSDWRKKKTNPASDKIMIIEHRCLTPLRKCYKMDKMKKLLINLNKD